MDRPRARRGGPLFRRAGVHGDAPRVDPRNVAPSDRLAALTRSVAVGGVPSGRLRALPRWAILRPLLFPPRPPAIPGSGAARVTGKLYIRTFGCQMNEYDSARMADLLARSDGLTPTDR